MFQLRPLAIVGWVVSVCLSLHSLTLSAAEPRFALRHPAYHSAAPEHWGGRWESPSKGHSGSIHMRLRPLDENHYQGLFYGRFAVVVPYVYRAPVTRVGQTLYSEKRLGPLGSYRMVLQQNPGQISGNWSAGSLSGPISMRLLR